MPDPTKPEHGQHGGEHHVDRPDDDEAFVGRKDGPDIDTGKREKELRRKAYER